MNTLTSIRTANPELENDRIYNNALLKVLKIAVKDMPLQRFGKKQKVKRNEGTNKIQWRRYKPLPVAVDRHALTEGVNPDGMKIGAATVEGSVGVYGAYIEVTRQTETYHLDKIIKEYTPILVSHASETLEMVVRDELEVNSGETFVGGGANEDAITSNDIITMDDCRIEANSISANRRKGHPIVGGKKYAVITSIEGMQDLIDDEDLLNRALVPGNTNKPIMDNGLEEYSLYNLSFFSNPLPYIRENATDVSIHSTYILGEDAYAVLHLDSAGIEYKKMGFEAKTGDNLGMTASIGWVVMGFGAKVLDPIACRKLVHTVSNPITREDVYASQSSVSS